MDEDAKVVFIQENDGKKTTEFAAGADEVQGFIDDLNADKTGAYKFDVSAILENGVAKTVIIRDQIDATYKKGEVITPVVGLPATTITGLTINVALGSDEKVTAYDKAVAKLESEGYKVEGVKIVSGGTEYKISASKGSVTGYEFTTDTTMYYKVTIKTDDTTAQEKLSAQSVYATKGVAFTVSVDKGSAWGSASYTITNTDAATSSDFTALTGTRNATNPNLLDISITLNVDKDSSITVKW